MAKKKPISGRIPPETDERLEEFREKRGLNQSDALRELLESGLEAELNPDPEDVEIGPLTQTERWFEQKLQKSFGLLLVSAPVALVSIFASAGLQNVLGLSPGHVAVMTMTFIVVLSTFVFTVSALGAAGTHIVLKSGFARSLELWYEGRQEAAS